MASSYVNDLRLNEMATGDASGTWGTTTNTNLELIGEALGYGTEGITTNADTHTTTVADGATDPGRAMYIEYTGTLDSACTITIAPNTINRMHFIENGTSGSQNIIIKQGSGATITIPPGDTKAVYLDGAGSGAAVVDAFASLNVVDLKVQDDLTVTDDATIGGTLGVTGIVTLTDDLIIGDGKTIGSASDVDAITIAANGQLTLTQTLIGTALDISGDIDVDGTTNLDVVDIDGAVDMASTLLVGGTVLATAAAAVNSTSAGGFGFASNVTQFYSFGADASTAGSYTFQTLSNNASVNVTPLQISSTGIIINEASGDLDFRIESNGNANMLFVDGGNDNVLLGTQNQGHIRLNQQLGLAVTGNVYGGISMATHSSSAGGNRSLLDFNRSRNTTIGSHTVVQSGDSLGTIVGRGDDGDEFLDAASIDFEVDGTPGNGDMPGRIVFATTADGAGSVTEAMRITSTSTLLISDTTAISGTTFDARDVDNVTSFAVGNNAAYVTRGQDTTAGANLIVQSNRGTLTSPTNTNNGDTLGRLFFRGYHTNGFYTSAIIQGIQDGANGTNDMPGAMAFSTSADGSATPTEAMRIMPTQQVSFGTSSPVAGSRIFTLASASTPYGIQTQNDATTGTMYVARILSNGSGEIGSIKTSNSVTAFNTSSDYRLKENVRPLEDGLSRVSQINPVKFDWISDGTSTEGFIAHELQEVFPDAVDGEKDGEHMQGVDYGKITPLLVKAIQEQQEQIEQLKTEIEKLH